MENSLSEVKVRGSGIWPQDQADGVQRRPLPLTDSAALYTRGVAESLFSELAWRADRGDSASIAELFASGARLGDRSLKVQQAAAQSLVRTATEPGLKRRHAVTTVRVDTIATRTFDASAVILVRCCRPTGETMLVQDWSLACIRSDDGWKIIDFKIAEFGRER